MLAPQTVLPIVEKVTYANTYPLCCLFRKQHKIGFVFYYELHRSSESKHTVRCNQMFIKQETIVSALFLLLFGCECRLRKLKTREIRTIPHLLLNIKIVVRNSDVSGRYAWAARTEVAKFGGRHFVGKNTSFKIKHFINVTI